jgi:nitroimidazol reductase NimA-like FMN-containing flavoprotein (pyridoxamine 5'-phosphate oxidase superfamily)
VNTTKTLLVSIGPKRCAELLATAQLGRLGVIVEGRPEIFPVNHVYDRESGAITFPVHEGTKMSGALEWPWVAFEVDGIDTETNTGWSVAVVGAAEEVVDEDTLARLSGERRVLWGEGAGARWLRIVPSKVTGREIQAYL